MISSLQNPKVKDWMRLHQKKYRVSQYLIFDEVLIEEAFKYGYLDTLIYVGSLPFDFANAIEVSEEVMMKLTKDEPKPYIGIAHKLEEKPQEIKKAVLLDDLQDPHNVGLILHSAELFGYDTVVLNDNTADIYHEKCLSASLTCRKESYVTRILNGCSGLSFPYFISHNLIEFLRFFLRRSKFSIVAFSDASVFFAFSSINFLSSLKSNSKSTEVSNSFLT
jgi:hypothetical protein